MLFLVRFSHKLWGRGRCGCHGLLGRERLLVRLGEVGAGRGGSVPDTHTHSSALFHLGVCFFGVGTHYQKETTVAIATYRYGCGCQNQWYHFGW